MSILHCYRQGSFLYKTVNGVALKLCACMLVSNRNLLPISPTRFNHVSVSRLKMRYERFKTRGHEVLYLSRMSSSPLVDNFDNPDEPLLRYRRDILIKKAEQLILSFCKAGIIGLQSQEIIGCTHAESMPHFPSWCMPYVFVSFSGKDCSALKLARTFAYQ